LNLFKRKSQGTKITDKIWMTQDGKWKAIIELAKTNPAAFFIAWFDETRQYLEDLFNKEGLPVQNILSVRGCSGRQLQNNPVVFAEHYPLRSKEQSLFTGLKLADAVIFSALDEPLFNHFGGEKIVQLMKQMGMKETESIENSMLSNAIRSAQEKIEKKLVIEQTARSQSDWLEKNFPS
jgi:hypothetical protein